MLLKDCHKASIYTVDKDYLCDAHVSRITDSSALFTFDEPGADYLRSEVLATFYDNKMPYPPGYGTAAPSVPSGKWSLPSSEEMT